MITRAPEQIEMPDNTRKLLEECLSQNREILQANCKIIQMIGSPMLYINSNDKAT